MQIKDPLIQRAETDPLLMVALVCLVVEGLVGMGIRLVEVLGGLQYVRGSLRDGLEHIGLLGAVLSLVPPRWDRVIAPIVAAVLATLFVVDVAKQYPRSAIVSAINLVFVAIVLHRVFSRARPEASR